MKRGWSVPGAVWLSGALTLTCLVTNVTVAAKPKRTPCLGGRFIVDGGPLLPGAPPTEVDVVELAAGTGVLSVGCDAANLSRPVKLSAAKTFTRVRATWQGCAGFTRGIRLTSARIIDGCAMLTATLRAKHLKKPFQAHLTACGDGFVDTVTGEQCDAGHPCEGGECDAQCHCPLPTTTTTTAPGGTTTTASGGTTTTTTSTGTTTTTMSVLQARPYLARVPTGYVAGTPTPLVVMLHGYAASAIEEDLYLGLSGQVDAKGFLYAAPDGTTDHTGAKFWNATDACCNFDHAPVDDVSYLNAVIGDMASKYSVDPKRVYVVGHSNGGFMAYRLACDLAAKVTGIVSFAGATWDDPAQCQPSQPVSVLQLHGTNDAVIPYAGGSTNGVPFPSAATSAAIWAIYDACTPTPTALPAIDLDSGIAGAETTVSAYDGCQGSSAVELWSIQGGSHIPTLVSTWFDPVYDFLQAHARP